MADARNSVGDRRSGRPIGRAILALCALLLGVGLLIHGLMFHKVQLAESTDAGDAPAARKSEIQLVRDVTVGGVIRVSETGSIEQTDTEEQPKLCPT